MARFGVNDADNYGGGSNSFFSLKDDKESARVRFLYNDINDVEGVSLHEVQVGNNTIDVECLRLYNDPVDKCPLCAAGYKVNAKMFIPLFDEDSQEPKIWTRGKKFIQKLSSLCTHFNPLVSTVFEVERNGKKGDTGTSYEMYNIKTDNSRVEDFPQINPEGLAFFQKSYDELDNYLRTGVFDDNKNQNREPQNSRQYNSKQPARETPVNQPIRRRPTYNGEDSF